MEVFIANEQDSNIDLTRVVKLARVAAEEEGVDPRAELSMMFVDSDSMAILKEQWIGGTGPTDVLSFPLDDTVVADLPYMLGDIVICPSVAKQQADTAGHDIEQELDLLVVHGFLHLIGYDHVKPAEARAMKHREKRILSEFARQQ